MADDIFAPPTKEELADNNADIFAPPSESELQASSSSSDDSPSFMEAASKGLASGVTLGFDDELAGALEAMGQSVGVKGAGAPNLSDIELQTPKGLNLQELMTAYKSARDKRRELASKAQQAHPGTFLAANLGGSLIPNPVGLLAKGGTKGAAAIGGLAGLGMSEADLTEGDVAGTAKDVGTGALIGTALGKVMPANMSGTLAGAGLGGAAGAASGLAQDDITADDMINRTLTGSMVGAGVGALGQAGGKVIGKALNKVIPNTVADFKKGAAGINAVTSKAAQESLDKLRGFSREATDLVTGARNKQTVPIDNVMLNRKELQNEIGVLSKELAEIKSIQLPEENQALKQLSDDIKNYNTDIKNKNLDANQQQIIEKNEQLSKIKTQIEELKVKRLEAEAQFKINEDLRKQQFETEQQLKKQDIERRNDEIKLKFNEQKEKELLDLKADSEILADLEIKRQNSVNDAEFNSLSKEMRELTQGANSKLTEIEKDIGQKIDDIYEKSATIPVSSSTETTQYINELKNLGVNDKILAEIQTASEKVKNPESLRKFKTYINTTVRDMFNNDPNMYKAKYTTQQFGSKLNDPLVKALDAADMKKEAAELLNLNQKYSRSRNLQETFVDARSSAQEAKRAGIDIQDSDDILSLVKNYTTALKSNNPIDTEKNLAKIDRFIGSLKQIDPDYAQSLSDSISDISNKINKVQQFKPKLRTTDVDELVVKKQLEAGIPDARPLSESEQKLVDLNKKLKTLKEQNAPQTTFEKSKFEPGKFENVDYLNETNKLNTQLAQLDTEVQNLKNMSSKIKDSKLTVNQDATLEAQQLKINNLQKIKIDKIKKLQERKSALEELPNQKQAIKRMFNSFGGTDTAVYNKLVALFPKYKNQKFNATDENMFEQLTTELKSVYGDKVVDDLFNKVAKEADTLDTAKMLSNLDLLPDGLYPSAILRYLKRASRVAANVAGLAVKKADDALITGAKNLDSYISKVGVKTDATSNLVKSMLMKIKEMPLQKQDAAMFALLQNPAYRAVLSDNQEQAK